LLVAEVGVGARDVDQEIREAAQVVGGLELAHRLVVAGGAERVAPGVEVRLGLGRRLGPRRGGHEQREEREAMGTHAPILRLWGGYCQTCKIAVGDGIAKLAQSSLPSVPRRLRRSRKRKFGNTAPTP